MSYARRHSTNVCPGNRVRYTGSGGPNTLSINGQVFNPSFRDNASGGNAEGNGAGVILGNCSEGWLFLINIRGMNLSPGTYEVGDDVSASWQPDIRTSAGAGEWSAEGRDGSGSVTLSRVSASGIAGSFSFMLEPRFAPASGVVAAEGAFDLGPVNGVQC